MEAYLPYLISVIGGAIIPAVLARFGIKVPVITPAVPTPAPVLPNTPWSPSPQPVPVPVVQPHASLIAALEWAAKANAKLVVITEADKEAAVSLNKQLHVLLMPEPKSAQ